MQIPILNGVYTNQSGDVRTAYPVNLAVVPKDSGVSDFYLRPFYGIVKIADTNGIDRGGINWLGVHYRVIGESLCKVSEDGAISIIGTIAGSDNVILDYSFDYLGILADKRFYIYSPSTGIQEMTDTDLGDPIDFCWADGYFLFTDGESLITNELNTPLSVLPFAYGSSEAAPDPVKAVKNLLGEVMALNRYTIEYFNNIGGQFFPFQRIDGARVLKGCVSTSACTYFSDSVAFVGGGKNENLSVYIAGSSTATKISTQEIDLELNSLSELDHEAILLESYTDNANEYLFVHLPTKTFVYDLGASQALQAPVWVSLSTSNTMTGVYRARNFVMCYGKIYCGDPFGNRLGILSRDVASHYGDLISWQFSTQIIYNDSKGAQVHELELAALTGRNSLNDVAWIGTNYSLDGMLWSQDRLIDAGLRGNRNQRLVWRKQGMMRNFRIQRFFGDSNSRLTFLRLEAQIEPLAR